MSNYRCYPTDYARYGNRTRVQTPNCQSSQPACTTPQPAYAGTQPVCPVPLPATSNCCETESSRDALSKMPIAMAYVPWQKWQNLYEIHKGLNRGTIFCDLDKPFTGNGGCQR